jgi:cyanate permease
VVFGAAFVVLLCAAGTRSAPSVLIDPLRDEFGWSRGTVGFAVSINVLLFGFIGPFAAALQQRYGLRRVTTIALVVIAAGAALTTQMSQPWHLFLLWGLVVGTGSGCMATVFASTVATRWFVARRGLVVGVLTVHCIRNRGKWMMMHAISSHNTPVLNTQKYSAWYPPSHTQSRASSLPADVPPLAQDGTSGGAAEYEVRATSALSVPLGFSPFPHVSVAFSFAYFVFLTVC